MFRQYFTHAAALLAAATTTVALFSTIAGLADGDRALLAAKHASTLVAGRSTPVLR